MKNLTDREFNLIAWELHHWPKTHLVNWIFELIPEKELKELGEYLVKKADADNATD
jgi:hypothetical protein